MIVGLKPYPAMKDSGVECLGKVPVHWEVRKLGRIGRFSKGNGGTKEDEIESGVPCVRYGDLYTRHQFFIERSRSSVSHEKSESYTRIRHGDVLFAGSGETIEEIGKSAVSLLSDPSCCGGDVIIFRPSIACDPRFLGLATDCPQAAYQKSCMGRGTTVMHIYGDELKYTSVALPPLPEQAAIVRYLDYVDRRVRRLVGAKRKLIAMLAEQKEAIVHRAVTRGLDPDVPQKDSGVEWLGKVPEHWEVLALKRVLQRLIDCEHKTAPAVDESEFRVVRTTAVRSGTYSRGGTYGTTSAGYREWTQRGVPEPGDVIFTREAPAGEACLVPPGEPVCLGQRTVLMKLRKDEYSPEFMVHMIYGGPPRTRIQMASQGSTVGHFNMDDIGWMRIYKPPLSEQREIVEYLRESTRGIDTTVSRAHREMDLLEEYRTRLIADVVTGKVDVREAAAALPEVDPLDAEGDLGEALEVDTEQDPDSLDSIPEEVEA